MEFIRGIRFVSRLHACLACWNTATTVEPHTDGLAVHAHALVLG